MILKKRLSGSGLPWCRRTQQNHRKEVTENQKTRKSKKRLLQVEEREELFLQLCVELSEQMCDGFVAVTHCHINLKMMGRLPESSLSSRRINILSGLEI